MGLAVSQASASYFEEWVVDAEVLEVYDGEEAAELRKKNPDFQVERNVVWLKIRLGECDYKGGHGRSLCKPGQELVVAVNTKEEAGDGIGVRESLRIRYFYSNGMSPSGVVNSHRWDLVEVLPAAGE